MQEKTKDCESEVENMAKFGINDILNAKTKAAGTDRGIQRDLFKPLRGKGSAGEYAPEIREHRRAGRQLFTRRTGTAYSIGESKRGIPYNRRTQT